ncbi:MAG: choice-of-anchor E domain-containing protein [Verrucomicrobiota bacterium]
MQKTIFAIVLSAAILPTLSFGATTTPQTVSYNFSGGTKILTFNQFDSTFGTLTGVKIEITLQKTGGNVTVDNDSSDSGTMTLTQELDLTVKMGATQLATLAAISSDSKFVGATSGDAIGFTATGNTDYVQFAPATASDSAVVNPSSPFTAYIGTGTFGLSAKLSVSNDFSFNNVYATVDPTTGTGNVTVTYTYTPTAVPEPTTWAMLVGGLGVLFAGRRLTRRS